MSLDVRYTDLDAINLQAILLSMISDYPELSALSPEDKVLLAAELWNEATEESDILVTDPGILVAIEKRLDDFRKNPSSGLSWDEVKDRIRTHG